MKNIKKNVIDLIGNTPLVELSAFAQRNGSNAHIIAKLERTNPGGSTKDRAALYMIEDAEKSGKLTKGSVIIEPTSGNTGIGLAVVAAAKGYRTVLTMPESMSLERRVLLKAYGAEIVLTEASKGMAGAIEEAQKLCKETPNSIVLGQFDNKSNARAHKMTTGPEILRDTDGQVDIVVSAVGTGGTITGIGEYLKEQKRDIKIVAVEPTSSPVLSGGNAGQHKIQGIGAGFVPSILNTEIIDEVICVSDEDAYNTTKRVAKDEGILVGISSGAALSAALSLAKRPENKGKNIVVIFTDTGERYLSSGVFD